MSNNYLIYIDFGVSKNESQLASLQYSIWFNYIPIYISGEGAEIKNTLVLTLYRQFENKKCNIDRLVW